MSKVSIMSIHTALEVFYDTVNSIKDIAIEKEIQQTQRILIREQARVQISQIENNSQVLREAIAKDHELHMRTLDIINSLLAEKSIIDQSIIEICQKVLLPMVNSTSILNASLNNSSNIITKNNLLVEY